MEYSGGNPKSGVGVGVFVVVGVFVIVGVIVGVGVNAGGSLTIIRGKYIGVASVGSGTAFAAFAKRSAELDNIPSAECK